MVEGEDEIELGINPVLTVSKEDIMKAFE